MNLQQLRYVREAVRKDLNLTEVSNALHTSQSGVSKQIRELELELGAQIFVRKGKRLTGLTPVGAGLVKLIEQVLGDVDALRRYPAEFGGKSRGRLVVATTHNQARYTLPGVISQFTQQYPGVQLELRQGTPGEAARDVASGDADIALATEALDRTAGLIALPCFSWKHVVITKAGHPLSLKSAVTLADIAAWPLVTYCPDFSGRAQVDRAFASAALTPEIRLAVMDAEDIKDYVCQDLGIGIISELAITAADRDLLACLTGTQQLFASSISKLAVKQGSPLPAFGYRFIELVAPHLSASFRRHTMPGHPPERLKADGLAEVRHFSELANLRPAEPLAPAQIRPTSKRRQTSSGVITAH